MNNPIGSYYSMPNHYGFHDMYSCPRPDGFRTALPDDPVVAMAYVPFQTDTTVYEDMKALEVGTLFPVLDLPYLQAGCVR